MPEDEQQLVHEFHDGHAADAYMELLKDEGIQASAPGLQHRGMLGMVGTYVSIPVRVYPDDLERAQELLALLTPEEGDEEEEEFEAPRLRRVAAMASLFLPFGAGHFYARSYPTGWLLLWGMAMGIYSALNLNVPPVFAQLPASVVLFDLVASQSAVRRYNEGRPWPALMQIVVAVVTVGALAYALNWLGLQLDDTVEVLPESEI